MLYFWSMNTVPIANYTKTNMGAGQPKITLNFKRCWTAYTKVRTWDGRGRKRLRKADLYICCCIIYYHSAEKNESMQVILNSNHLLPTYLLPT